MGRRSKKRAPKKKVTEVVAPEFPRLETTDFDDPDSHAVWALAGLPHMKGAPLGMPVFMLRAISRRLWDCGFRFHPELRTIKYRPPHTGQGLSMLSAAGEWVPIDTPDDEPTDPVVSQLRDTMAQLPVEQRQQIVNALGLDTTTQKPVVERVPYTRADGTTVWVTPAQARAWANAKKAAGGRAGPHPDGEAQ